MLSLQRGNRTRGRARQAMTGGGGGGAPVTFTLTQIASSVLDFDDAPVPGSSVSLTGRYTPIGLTFSPYAGAVSLVSATGIPGVLPHPPTNTSSNGIVYGYNFLIDVDPSLCFDGLRADLSGSGRTSVTFVIYGSMADPETGLNYASQTFAPPTGPWVWIFDQTVKDSAINIGYITQVYVTSAGSNCLIDNLHFTYSGQYDDVFTDFNLWSGTSYSATVATGPASATPYTLSLVSGSLPTGLSISSTTTAVAVNGTPTAAGSYSAVYNVGHSNGTVLPLTISLKVR